MPSNKKEAIMSKIPMPTFSQISTFCILLIIASFSGFDAEAATPEITSGPITFVLTDTVAIITWETDVDSDSTVQYGPENSEWGAFTSQENDADLVTQHQVKITDLTPNTEYF